MPDGPMLTPDEITALIAVTKNAPELARMAGVHLRTAYKWLTRYQPPKIQREPPPLLTTDRHTALLGAIDRTLAMIAANEADLAAIERLQSLARAAKMLRIIDPPKGPGDTDTEGIRDKLNAKLGSSDRYKAIVAANPDAYSRPAAKPEAPLATPGAASASPLPRLEPNPNAAFGGNVRKPWLGPGQDARVLDEQQGRVRPASEP